MWCRVPIISRRGAICFALLVSSAVSLLLAHPAAAQTTDFSAEIKGTQQLPFGCPDGAQLCGDAIIEEFGAAQYRFFIDPANGRAVQGVHGDGQIHAR